ncbi:MAG: hypothetical protein ACSLFN_11165, partial [Candidatus Limnocylindrales bacterium]
MRHANGQTGVSTPDGRPIHPSAIHRTRHVFGDRASSGRLDATGPPYHCPPRVAGRILAFRTRAPGPAGGIIELLDHDRQHPHPRRAPGSTVRRSAGGWSAAARALLVAVALLVALITPAAAGSGPTRLSDGDVSPRAATTATSVTFTVLYRNREGSPADWVRVSVAGAAHAMTRSGGEDWKREVRFSWSGALPAGTHAVVFEAMSRDRFDDSLDGGSVTVTVPPTPKPTPKP